MVVVLGIYTQHTGVERGGGKQDTVKVRNEENIPSQSTLLQMPYPGFFLLPSLGFFIQNIGE